MNNKRLPVLDDFYNYRYLSTPEYCLQKDWLSYVISYADKKRKIYVSEVSIKDLKTKEVFKISAGGTKEYNPRFNEDGSKMIFLSNASGTDQIWLKDFNSGEVKKLTNMRYGVSDPQISPNGKQIAFLSAAPSDEKEELLQVEFTEEEKKLHSIKRKKEAIEITDFGYKTENDKGFATPEGNKKLWIINVGDDKAVCLTDGDRNHVMPVWSPDGSYILIVSNRARSRAEFLGLDLFKVDPNTKEITRLTDSVYTAYYPKKIVPRYTPDGKYIVIGGLNFEGLKEDDMPPTHLYKVSINGDKPTRIFEDGFPCDGAVRFLYNADNYGEYYETMQISGDSKYAYFISGWHGEGNIYRVNLEGEPKIEHFTRGKQNYASITKSYNGKIFALRADDTHPYEIYCIDEKTGESELVVNSNEWLNEVKLSNMEEMWIQTLDRDANVQGWVIKPQNAKEGEKYPAVLYIHGGPTPFYGYALTLEYQCLAAAGIGVILVNPRGSSGYGAEFMDIEKAMNGTAYYDLLQFVDEACKKFAWIDRDRLGVCGGSYGGYMTNYMITHCKIFKAAATHRSVINDLISYASSDTAGSVTSRDYANFKDFMVDKMKSSTITYAQNIDIPLLILHGMCDMRCPVEGAHQLFTAVKDLHPDLPVRMVLFPKSNHDLLGEGPMYLREIHYRENIEWFKKYL